MEALLWLPGLGIRYRLPVLTEKPLVVLGELTQTC